MLHYPASCYPLIWWKWHSLSRFVRASLHKQIPFLIGKQYGTITHSPERKHFKNGVRDDVELPLEVFLFIGSLHQLVEDTCLLFLRLRLVGPLPQRNRQLTGNNSCDKEYKKGQPLLKLIHGKGVEWRNHEKVKREKGDNRGQHSRIQATSTCQR